MKNQRMFITGVASPVGARLAARLLDEGHEVVGVDDLSSGSWATIRELERAPRFAFVEHDIARPFRVDADAMFHLAVPSSRRRCENAPLDAMLASVVGTGRVLELAGERAMRVVMATSVDRWGEGVRCAEALAVEHVRARRVDVRLVRTGRVFGENVPLDDGGVVTRLAIQAARGEHLDTGPWPMRSVRVSYVDDVVESLVRAMRHELRLPPFVTPLFDTTPHDVANAVASVLANAPTTERGIGGASSTGAAPGPTSMPVSGRPTMPETLPASLVLGLEHSVAFETAVARTVLAVRARLEGLAAVKPPAPGAEPRGLPPVAQRAS